MIDRDLIEISISDVSITNVGFAIFLKPINIDTTKVVPIFIGPLETYSISGALDGVLAPRPNTHDLLIKMLQEMEANVLHIIINDIVGSVFYARIVIQTEDGIFELDARPSDAVAIAIRSQCPMYIHKTIYEEASIIIDVEVEDKEAFPDETSELVGEEIEVQRTLQPINAIEKLKIELEKAIEIENFEEAAVLRDKIKKLDKKG